MTTMTKLPDHLVEEAQRMAMREVFANHEKVTYYQAITLLEFLGDTDDFDSVGLDILPDYYGYYSADQVTWVLNNYVNSYVEAMTIAWNAK